MPPLFDDFVHVASDAGAAVPEAATALPRVSNDFFNTSHGGRWFTEGVIASSIKKLYRKHHLTVAAAYNCNLLAFADSHDDATYVLRGEPKDSLLERQYRPPARRYGDENGGAFLVNVVFGSYDYIFKGSRFVVYIVEGSDGLSRSKYNYILLDSEVGQEAAQARSDELVAAAIGWGLELHNEVLVFDNGMWQKSSDLWQNIQKSNWEDVILDQGKKDAIIEDVIGFFRAEEKYKDFGVPWKVSPSLIFNPN
jgi:transitional endoplasmic reticulum ATPase